MGQSWWPPHLGAETATLAVLAGRKEAHRAAQIRNTAALAVSFARQSKLLLACCSGPNAGGAETGEGRQTFFFFFFFFFFFY